MKGFDMSVEAIEAYVENGQVRLPPDAHLPEHAKVYVVVPKPAAESLSESGPVFELPRRMTDARIHSPRLVNPADVRYFKKEHVQAADNPENPSTTQITWESLITKNGRPPNAKV